MAFYLRTDDGPLLTGVVLTPAKLDPRMKCII